MDPSPLEEQPLVLIDIDGVINATGRKAKYWNDSKIIKLMVLYPNDEKKELEIYYSPTVIRAINSWTDVAEVRWLSPHDEVANTFIGPALGLQKLEMARSSLQTSKFDCVNQWVNDNPDRVVIWIDENLSKYKNDHENNPLYSETIFKRKSTILVSPRKGLISEHIAFMDKILKDKKETSGKRIHKFDEGGHSDGCVIA